MPELGTLRAVSARGRLGVAIVCGAIAAAIAAFLAPWQVTVLAGWDVTALVWCAWVWSRAIGSDAAATEAHATAADDSRAAADTLLISASVASLVGVALTLIKAHRGVALTAVAVVTVVLSWLAVHTLFTLRYARLYYAEGGGVDFHDNAPPAYGDFAYLAFTLGMTYQVSDTDLVSRPIRMTALRHALLSYLFGTSVIASP